ncbi:hypothetical protein [Falsiroseomonas sp. E2-1-a20]|uniref:hypothetical protein n=1 Tax=Falsiroseomonas sp. E2-1-a20 TaxID=3239300 RepID=UPI003F3E5581
MPMLRSICVCTVALILSHGNVTAQPAPASGLPAPTRLAMPGEQHRWLEPLVGAWSVEMLIYPGPGAAALVSSGLRAMRESILDGR